MLKERITNKQIALLNLFEDVRKRDCSYSSIVKVFWEMLERNANSEPNLSQAVSIDVGKSSDKGFLSYLHSSFKNPLVTIRYCGNEPQLRISSFDKHNGGSTVLNLTTMENIVVKEYRVGGTFLTYDVSFHYSPADMDYKIHVIVRNE